MSRHPERRRARPASFVLLAVGLGAALVLSGCSDSQTASSPPPSATATAAPEASPSAAVPAGPALIPEGSAEDNLPLFTSVTAAVWAGPENVSGRAYVDALVAAGFDKAAMQVTPDQTTIGNPAESIQFAVRWGADCLVGQVGPSSGAPVTVVTPGLGDGKCLVGATRPIDW
ncbi:hypothetical protein NQ152_09430 [Microbacterium sp. zg.B48]|uniref:DUF6993 domain-containing protein n=1 Tax=Microbacterium sp. zg.B48 TaxID=2969408 RepID=UPI00214BDFF7|nr:hypothetical protein [Microbacterium sp. zg.B48]MCR2763729.1 hypothetical protein [Microbacterium sp. zg.B48]